MCEYCIHTNRQCVYPEEEKSGSESDDSSASQSNLVQHMDEFYQNSGQFECVFENKSMIKLNQPTNQLNITKFELRLLDFFKEFCIPIFSFKRNREIENVWLEDVPPIFMKSELVKKSMLSFSTMIMLPMCHLDSLWEDDTIPDKNGTLFNAKIDSAYLDTTRFFTETISHLNSVIRLNTNNYPVLFHHDTAAEVTISSILVYVFLGLHPHKLVPLLSLDRSTADYVSITRGIKESLGLASFTLASSPVSRIFNMKEDYYTPKIEEMPLFTTLYHELAAENLDDIRSSIYLRSIKSMHELLHKVTLHHYPVLFYRWLIMVETGFYDLIYLHEYWALRELNVFASISLIMHFYLVGTSNIWYDYVIWFKEYTFDNYQHWIYPIDEALYELTIIQGYKTPLIRDFSVLRGFDPIQLVIENQYNVVSLQP